MIIKFKIHYITHWGQSLYLILNPSEQKSSDSFQNIEMQGNANFEWTTEISVDSSVSSISYQYAVLNSDKSFDHEFGKTRKINITPSQKIVNIQDSWRKSHG